ncbi:unnamed protein product [Polarella glacialis]|uniref:Uncharacterized protein n=1 Tax=Polarella glacialis TaxID=89957 RepID=A0A813GAW4_POLGL|nr:unnamed protein product [Polarella glacialis]
MALATAGLRPCVACVLAAASVAGEISPGTRDGCWTGDFNYHRCCMTNDDAACFPHQNSFTRIMCCSGLYEVMESWKDNNAASLGVRHPPRPLWPGLATCLGQEPDLHPTLDRNSLTTAVECVAKLPEVSVALDLFLGGGNTMTAAAKGMSSLSSQHSRPLEVFSFERDLGTIVAAGSPDGILRSGPWVDPMMLDVHFPENQGLTEQILHFQALLVFGEMSEAPKDLPMLWVLHGRPYPRESLGGYAWNALDVLCQHRAPLDLVVIDSQAHSEQEWLIIEAVCRPRLVVLANVNIPSASSWIAHRLELQGTWQLEARGQFALHSTPWVSLAETRRTRAWVIYSDLLQPVG